MLKVLILNLKLPTYLRISKYNKYFAKDYTSNISEEVFVITKVKYTVSWTQIIEKVMIFISTVVLLKRYCYIK